jgi:hypothetical protein
MPKKGKGKKKVQKYKEVLQNPLAPQTGAGESLVQHLKACIEVQTS